MNVDDMITGRFIQFGDPDLPWEERVRRAVSEYLEAAGGSYPNLAILNPIHLDKPEEIDVEEHKIKVLPSKMIGRLITYVGIGKEG
jgi:5S rRNA maturation endonuclease (ribonuclease M5)